LCAKRKSKWKRTHLGLCYYLNLCYYIVTSKPRRFFCKVEGMRRRRNGTYSETVSQIHAQRRVLRVERTFMASEYGSMSQKNVLILSQGTLTRDWTTCDLWGQKEEAEVVIFNYKKRERFLLTFKIYWVKQL